MTPQLRTARITDLAPASLYALLRLRVDVFVVEQQCPYPELDGRDTAVDTVHMWYERGGIPVSYLRIVAEPDGAARIGRVCTASDMRGAGLAGRLLGAALEAIGERETVLGAQSRLTGFYGRYGFLTCGPEYLEDGIPHTPMRRGAS